MNRFFNVHGLTHFMSFKTQQPMGLISFHSLLRKMSALGGSCCVNKKIVMAKVDCGALGAPLGRPHTGSVLSEAVGLADAITSLSFFLACLLLSKRRMPLVIRLSLRLVLLRSARISHLPHVNFGCLFTSHDTHSLASRVC